MEMAIQICVFTAFSGKTWGQVLNYQVLIIDDKA